MQSVNEITLRPNWTTAAGALEGVLAAEGLELPRHAVMGLTGHAWHLCVPSAGGITALPNGPHDLNWQAMVERYSYTGLAWERFGRQTQASDLAEIRNEAIKWASERLDAGLRLIGFDLQVHEFAIVLGYDKERKGFLVASAVSEELGDFAPWSEWPTSSIGIIELFATQGASDPDPEEAVVGALQTALIMMSGEETTNTQPRGTAAFEAWADAFEGTGEVDRVGNAYTLAVLQAARTDGAAFLGDLSAAIPAISNPLLQAQRAVLDLTQTLSPLLTLFPFPAGGHGNVSNPGMREAAANALRRAAGHERRAAEAIAEAIAKLGAG
ncbi:MAG TPA: hypothetical protein DGL25_01580 [Dehalococcoidia bacterium]|nr:hypothetical protein [Dehalococcoidia bacterium]|tara:strand:- start:25067 stop:26044 length:978 start_codon:yes stop_codon:yes gene_type:complete